MEVWRIHLKAASKAGIDQRQMCISKGIVGVGWQIDVKNTPVIWEEYYLLAVEKYGDRGWRNALDTIKNKIQVNDLIWTRDWIGNYYLGRITSDWFYNISDECADADIVNVCNCEWQKIGTVEAVPGKVVSSFRASRTVQRIVDDTVLIFSKILYNQKTKTNYYLSDNLAEVDIFSLLSTDDCEDVLAIYLQSVYDYFVIPSSCKEDTMAYEFELKHRLTGKSAVVQVKTGHVSLNRDEFIHLETDVFLFATCGLYYGLIQPNIKIIAPNAIKEFLYQKTELLPEKIKVWVELTR